MDVSSVFEHLPDMVVCRDSQRSIEMVNKAFLAAFGHNAEYWVGRTLDDAISGSQIGAFDENRTYGHINIDGQLHWVEWTEVRVHNGGTMAVGRLNLDRRKNQRSENIGESRDRRRNQMPTYLEQPAEIEPKPTIPTPKEVSAPKAKLAQQILLAEDDLLNAKLARTLLERAGCVVTHVENGHDAVEAAKTTNFDLVFMDVRMPVMGGLEATKSIRKLGGAWSTIPIVALTANAFAEDKKACHGAGMDGFLTKPIRVDALLAAQKRWTKVENRAKSA